MTTDHTVREWVTKRNDEALLVNGLEGAIPGVAERGSCPALVVYDAERCMEILMERRGPELRGRRRVLPLQHIWVPGWHRGCFKSKHLGRVLTNLEHSVITFDPAKVGPLGCRGWNDARLLPLSPVWRSRGRSRSAHSRPPRFTASVFSAQALPSMRLFTSASAGSCALLATSKERTLSLTFGWPTATHSDSQGSPKS